jgi:hypothetical protein
MSASPLAELWQPPSAPSRRASEWQKAKRVRRLEEQEAAGARLVSWGEPRAMPPPGPARQCQWIEHGCFCNERSVLGKSWCAEHCARAFTAEEAD